MITEAKQLLASISKDTRGSGFSDSAIKDLQSTDIKQGDKERKSFTEVLQSAIESLNASQSNADAMSTNIATGKTQNIHETMLAISKAEIEFKLMVQVRNKALDAYQEIMRMQI